MSNRNRRLLSRVLVGMGVALLLCLAWYSDPLPPQGSFRLLETSTSPDSFSQAELSASSSSLPREASSSPQPIEQASSLEEALAPPPQEWQQMPAPPPLPTSADGTEVDLVGSIQIPKLGLSQNIVEGHGDNELMLGVGHSPGTALPGQEGNCVLPGHRNYLAMRPFYALDQLEPGDWVYLQRESVVYAYQVTQLFEVEPTEVWVMEPVEGSPSLLTLITCTPLYTYHKRLIVRAGLATQYLQS